MLLDAPADLDSVFDCSVQILDGFFHDCRARVMWVRPCEEEPSTWAVGFAVEMNEDKRWRFEALLARLLSELRGRGES